MTEAADGEAERKMRFLFALRSRGVEAAQAIDAMRLRGCTARSLRAG